MWFAMKVWLACVVATFAGLALFLVVGPAVFDWLGERLGPVNAAFEHWLVSGRPWSGILFGALCIGTFFAVMVGWARLAREQDQ